MARRLSMMPAETMLMVTWVTALVLWVTMPARIPVRAPSDRYLVASMSRRRNRLPASGVRFAEMRWTPLKKRPSPASSGAIVTITVVSIWLQLEHFQEKWTPVFRPKMRQRKNARAVSVSGLCETALARPLRKLRPADAGSGDCRRRRDDTLPRPHRSARAAAPIRRYARSRSHQPAGAPGRWSDRMDVPNR